MKATFELQELFLFILINDSAWIFFALGLQQYQLFPQEAVSLLGAPLKFIIISCSKYLAILQD